MEITSVSSVSSRFTEAIDSNEFNELLREIGTASWEKLASAYATSSAAAAQRLRALQTLSSFASRVAGLSTIDSGKAVVLGADLATAQAFKAESAEAGLKLTTDQTYNIATVTKDANGNTVIGPKRLATNAERSAVEAGTLVTAADASGAEVRSITTNGVTQVFKLFKNESTLIANKAEIDQLLAVVPALARELMKQVQLTSGQLTGIAVEMKLEEARIFEPANKREASAVERQIAEQREAMVDRSIRKQERDRNDLRRAG